MDQVALWRCLVAYGVDHSIAVQVCRGAPQSFSSALDKLPPTPPSTLGHQPVLIDLEAPTESEEFRALAQLLATLPEASRRAVVARMVGDVEVDRLHAEAAAAESDLADGLRLLKEAEPHRPIDDLFAAIQRLPAPELVVEPTRSHPGWLSAGALAAALLAGVAGAVLTSSPNNYSAPTPEPTPTTTTPPKPTLDPELFREPDRKIEISVTEDGTLIRHDPLTRRVVWESSPFEELKIVSIDPNTVTIESRGYRLFVSLTDGTLLPP